MTTKKKNKLFSMFITFKIGLFTFGGGYMIPLMERK